MMVVCAHCGESRAHGQLPRHLPGCPAIGGKPLENVVDLEERKKEPIIRRHRVGSEDPRHGCWHRTFQVDTSARSVECAKCGAELDPYDVLGAIAAECDRYVDMLQRRKIAEAELNDLQAELEKLKSRVRYHRKRVDGG
jgi:hypothetical protein